MVRIAGPNLRTPALLRHGLVEDPLWMRRWRLILSLPREGTDVALVILHSDVAIAYAIGTRAPASTRRTRATDVAVSIYLCSLHPARTRCPCDRMLRRGLADMRPGLARS